jgi:hypothetical protein
MTFLINILTWIINGFLVIVFFLVDHLVTVLLLPAAAAFVMVTPAAQRGWAIGAGTLAVAASLISPTPVPIFLGVIALVSSAALYLEHYNRPAVLWNILRSVSLYSLAGLGFSLWRGLRLADSIQDDVMTIQGATYLNAIIGIAMYVIPLGIIILLAQSILAHPPIGRPEEIITNVRTRGKGQ